MKYSIHNNNSQLSKTKSSGIKKFMIIGFLLILTIGIIGGLILKSSYETALDQKNSESSEKVTIKIDTGSSLSYIAQLLIDNKLMPESSKGYFEFYVKTNNLYPKFQAGSFKIPMNLTPKEIASTLQNGGIPDLWITIPEGLRKDEIADIFSKEFGDQEDNAFSKAEFLNLTTDTNFIKTLHLKIDGLADLEGFLFPDKYLFLTNTNATEVIVKMVDNFQTRTNGNYDYDLIKKASMIEREGTTLEDKKIISDIIDRRLSEGWYLGFDTTSLYAQKNWKVEPDVINDSPYNTYKNLGYPPTPICNPGIASITAAQNPTPNNYYFFLHDKESKPHYAVTYAEHTRNAEIYLNQ